MGTDPEVISARELFSAHASFVASFLFRLGVPASDVPDLVQEVFIVTHRKGGFVVGQAKPQTWLSAIALRVASDFRRSKHQRMASASVAADGLSTTADNPESKLENTQSLDRVQRALESLSNELREVFVLFEIEGIPCVEIAELVSAPVGTVYSRLHTARKQFTEAHARLCIVEARSAR